MADIQTVCVCVCVCELQERKHHKKEPTSFFEHFVVVGLRAHSDVQSIEAAFARKKLWQRDPEKATLDFVNHNAPTLEPEVIAIFTSSSIYMIIDFFYWSDTFCNALVEEYLFLFQCLQLRCCSNLAGRSLG